MQMYVGKDCCCDFCLVDVNLFLYSFCSLTDLRKVLTIHLVKNQARKEIIFCKTSKVRFAISYIIETCYGKIAGRMSLRTAANVIGFYPVVVSNC